MGLLSDIILILGLSAVVIYLCQRLKLPHLVGFLITGVILGPGGLKLIGDLKSVHALAEIGVVLLLFNVGLEISLVDLLRMRRSVFISGFLQVASTFLLTALIVTILGMGMKESVVIGFLLSLSSTAVVMKILQDRAELETPHGNSAMGILVFQDLAVVPMMLAIPLLAGQGELGFFSLSTFLGKIILVIGAILALSQWVIPRVLFQVAKARSRELFLITTLGVCLFIAWLTGKVGLSLAIGAFIAGMVISDSEYSHQALGNILPFRDVFSSFFFVSIGMLFDLRFLLGNPLSILGSTALIVLVKCTIAALSVLVVGYSLRTALLVGLSLSQVGEFSFVLASAARGYDLMGDNTHQIFLGVSVLSMALTPFLIDRSSLLAELFMGLPLPRKIKRGAYPIRQAKKMDYRDHLVIIGYGFNGRNLARAAKTAGIPYVVVEMNPAVVREEQKKGEVIYYGDASQEAILLHARVPSARAVAVVINDPAATRRITHAVRRLNERVYLLVRTRYLTEIKPLKTLGADDVIPEEFETSVAIFSRILEKYLLPREEIEEMVAEIRSDSYRLLRSYSEEPTSVDGLRFYLPEVEITSFRIPLFSSLIGKTLLDTEMRKRYGVTLLAIRRGKEVISNPPAEARFEAEDVLFVVGPKARIEEVKGLFNYKGGKSDGKSSAE